MMGTRVFGTSMGRVERNGPSGVARMAGFAPRALAATALVSVMLLGGCKSAEQRALDTAKQQAAATNTAQQIQYIDGNGDTVTTVVQPPAAGQPQQVTTTLTPPAPGPIPHRTRPVVTPLNGGATSQPNAQQPVGADGTTQTLAATSSATTTTTSQSYAGKGTADGNGGGYANGANGAAPSGAPAGPAAPALNLSVPAGTELAIRINQNISVKHSHAGDHFTGEVASAVSHDGVVVIPAGTHVSGRVDEAHRRGHFRGRSILELRLTAMNLNGYEYALDTHDAVRTKKGKGKRTAGWIGGLTGAGMLIGGVASGGVGLAIGGASGAGAGTLIAGATGNRDIDIPAESIVHFRLADRLVVQNP